MTIMRVWQAHHDNGQPRKVWAAAIINGKLITRWAEAGRRLCKGDEIALNGATPSSKLAEKEREKRNKRYDYLGEKEVSPEGDISDLPEPPKEDPQGFFTLSTAIPAETVWGSLRQVGYEVQHALGQVIIRQGSAAIKIGVIGNQVTAAYTAAAITPPTLLAMLYIAKQDSKSVLISPKGEPIKPVFESLVELFGQDAEAMRDTAEQLNLIPKALAKSLKTKSGLFAFGQ